MAASTHARMATSDSNMQQENSVVQTRIRNPSSATTSSPSDRPPSTPDLVQQLQILEISINSKFSELQNLIQQHDRSMKKLLKSHQNSLKQSVKAQLEKSQIDHRQYIDEALQRHGSMVQESAEPTLPPSTSKIRAP